MNLSAPNLAQTSFLSSINYKEIQEFIEINMNPITPISIVWEAFETTCRGWIISYTSYKNKDKLRKKTEMISKLKDLELKHMRGPMNISFKQELFLTRAEVQLMLHEESAFSLYKLRW